MAPAIWQVAFLACLPVSILFAIAGEWVLAGVVFVFGTPLFWSLRNRARARRVYSPRRSLAVGSLDPYGTPYRRFSGPPRMIDKAVGRCKELKSTVTMDSGEGYLILTDDAIGFLTDHATKGPPSSWTMVYSAVRSFDVRKGPFGMWRLIIYGPPPPEGRTFHIRLGSYGAQNAAHILRAKGVTGRG